MFLNAKNILLDFNIYSPEFFNKLKNITVDKRAVFFIALGKQLRSFGLLLLLSTSVIGPFVFLAYTVFQGVAIGASLEILTIIYGISGIGIYSYLVLPQGIFYFLAYSILLVQGTKKKEKEEKTPLFSGGKNEKRKKIILSLFLLGIGALTEAYCNLFSLIYLVER